MALVEAVGKLKSGKAGGSSGNLPEMETYIKKVREDVDKELKRHQTRPRDNISPAERKALNQLKHRDDIVIKPADKGSAVVILSKDDYIQEGERQLSNTTYYCKLTKDPSTN